MRRFAVCCAAAALAALAGACVSSVELPDSEAARVDCSQETNPSLRRACQDGIDLSEHARDQ